MTDPTSTAGHLAPAQPGGASGPAPIPHDAIVLAGGVARRLGGTDKTAVRIGGRTLLERVVAACPDARHTVVVGAPRPLRAVRRKVTFIREEPSGGGPLAALAAGLAEVRSELVLLLAADLPFLDSTLVQAVTAPPPGSDGVILTDAAGHDQPLTAAYRTAPLQRTLDALHGEHHTLQGLPLRLVLPRLRLHRLPMPTNGPLDCDTWADIAAARARIGDDGRVLEEWLAAVKAELDIDPEVDTTALLDAARDAAHGVIRPAAPLTTFLLGYAAAEHGTGAAEAATRIADLAARWSEEQQTAPGRDSTSQGSASQGEATATEVPIAAGPATAEPIATEPATAEPPAARTAPGSESAAAQPEGSGR